MPKILAKAEDWLHIGLDLFAEGGEAALSVEKMARLLGCSKSSFYWYFKDRGTFVEAMLKHWVEIGTGNIIQQVDTQQEPESQLRELFRLSFSSNRGKDFMFHLRHLAAHQPKYYPILEQTENRRINYITSLLMKIGWPETDAYEKSDLIYHYYLGWYERHKHVEITTAQVENVISQMTQHLKLFSPN